MYIERTIEVQPCNVCWCGKALRFTYSVFLVLGIQLTMRMHHIVICGLSGATIFFDIIS